MSENDIIWIHGCMITWMQGGEVSELLMVNFLMKALT